MLPVDGGGVGAGLGEGDQILGLVGGGAAFPHLDVFLGDAPRVGPLQFGGEQLADHAHGAGGIGDIDHRMIVLGRYLHRRVGLGGGGPADQERYAEALALHLRRHQDHLLQRGRDEAGEADDVHALVAGLLEDGRGGDHDPQVDDLIVVALEDDADDVLADVVDVALDRGHEHLAGGLMHAAGLLRLQEGLEIGHRLLHDPGGLDHLGQEHLARAEEIADLIHAIHEGALDDLEG